MEDAQNCLLFLKVDDFFEYVKMWCFDVFVFVSELPPKESHNLDILHEI